MPPFSPVPAPLLVMFLIRCFLIFHIHILIIIFVKRFCYLTTFCSHILRFIAIGVFCFLSGKRSLFYATVCEGIGSTENAK